jgi:serine/threonine-protein kinase
MTETGLSLGTPHYMSPEQASADRDLSSRSDVYSLGCVLYEMIAGQPPHTGPSARSVLVRILTENARPLTELRHTVPPNVAATVTKAIEKLPADRFESAKAFMEALEDEDFTYRARPEAAAGVSATAVAPAPVRQRSAGRWLLDPRALVAALAIALAGWGWFRSAPTLPVTRASIRLDDFSFRPLGELMVSPDGSRFVLVGLEQPATMYWRYADEENFRSIPGTESAEYASFSPDGGSLVFGTNQGGTIQRVALSGGAPQPVAGIPTPSVGGIDWGDDGTVVFTLNQGLGLFRVPYTGGEPEELLEQTVRLRNPKLLPGSNAVIFTDLATLSTHLLDLETDSVRVIWAGAIDATYVDTGHLLYTDVAGTLWAVAFDPNAGEIRGEPVTVFDGLTKPQDQYARFSVSQNGTLVYGAGLSGGGAGSTRRLVIVNLDGSEEVLVLTPRDLEEVKWSPDRRSVVYQSVVQQDASPHIFTYDVELGTTPRQLTFEGGNGDPVFSPDGTRVAFSSRREGTDELDLFVKTLDDDTPARSLITLAGDQIPTQWPSDTLIVFMSETPSDLWMLDLSDPDSPRPEVYLPLEADLDEIKVSRDGTLAAYASDETGIDEVYIRSFPNPGERTPVSQGGGSNPFWSPDGNTVYYWAPEVNGQDTFIAARIQREPTPVVLSRDTLFAGPYWQDHSDLHPDGDRLVVPQDADVSTNPAGAASERFLVVTNWFEELMQRVGN